MENIVTIVVSIVVNVMILEIQNFVICSPYA